jgi:UPF0755 protein
MRIQFHPSELNAHQTVWMMAEERTAEEREAARLERERRRAERAGRAARVQSPTVPSEPVPVPRAEELSPVARAEEPSPVARAEESPPVAHVEEPPAEATEPEALAAEEPFGAAPDDEELYEVPYEEPFEPFEPPPKASPRQGARIPRRSGPNRRARRAPRSPRTASRATRRPPERHSRRARVLALIMLILAAVIVWFCVELFQPFHGSGHGQVTVVIPAHAHLGQIAGELERDGVISSGFFFEIRATLSGDRSNLRSGTYRLQQGMSYGDVLSILTKAPPAAKVTEVTTIPGKTRAQIDKLLREQGVKGSYSADTRTSPLLRPSWYGAPRTTDSLEGFLFPDTYQVREPISIPALVADQLKQFRQEFQTVNFSYAKSKNLTPYDVLIIASMVEAEAQTATDRPLVASVIYNRLHAGMPLQIDATSCYIVGGEPCNLSGSSLLNSPSPYNTRIHAGLPPTPIDNPSIASIEAAAHPARTNYLYFVVEPCGNGKMLFSGNYQQFLGAQQRYLSARAKRGGRSPAECG